MSVDPLTKSYPWYTPYQFAGNLPIWAVDLDGLEEKKVTLYLEKDQDGNLYVKDTKVTIDPKKKFWGVAAKTYYATTSINYVYEGIDYFGGMVMEPLVSGGMKPSAIYNYTIDNNELKQADDIDYAGFNPFKWEEIITRDTKAPDNAATMQDLEVLQVVADLITKSRSNKGKSNPLETKKENIKKETKKSNKDSYKSTEKEHTSNARKGTEEKHQKGRARNQKDKGGEKGDARRKRNR